MGDAMLRGKMKAHGSLLFACLLAFGSPLRADGVTDEAERLLAAGKSAKAFALLEPLESERAGDVAYDLLLGRASLGVGQNTRAIFALERVLALEPSNTKARAEIARAYLLVGEADNARKELATIEQQGVPSDVSQSFDRYLAALKRLDGNEKATLNAYAELLAGYDSNVNLGPNRDSVLIPGQSPVPIVLSREGRAREDGFAQLGGGVSTRLPINSSLAVLAGLSGAQRFNFSESDFNLGNVDANLGAVWTSGKNVLTVMGQYGTVSVDHDHFRTAAGLTGQWQYNLDARNQLSAYLQYTDLRYDDQKIRDAQRWVGGGAYAHLWRDGAMVFASLYGVSEKPKREDADYLGFDGVGVRFGGRVSLNDSATVFGNLAYERRRYDATDPAYQLVRSDRQYGATLGLAYGLAQGWTLTPQVSLMRNESNAVLSDYRRNVVSVALRREF